MLRPGSRSPPPSAFRLAWLAGSAAAGWYGPSGTWDSGSKTAILPGLKVPSSTGNGSCDTLVVLSGTSACRRSVRYWILALSIGGTPNPASDAHTEAGLRTAAGTKGAERAGCSPSPPGR